MEEVEFRDIPGFPGYRAGSDGSIWSCRRGWRNLRKGLPAPWKKMSVFIDRAGYSVSSCMVRSDGTTCTRFVHKLVCLAFHGEQPDGTECCHNDGDKTNNCASNLRWDTPQANDHDLVIHGTMRRAYRPPVFNAATAAEVRRQYEAGRTSYGKLAAHYGVAVQTIQAIIKRKTWRHV